MSNVLLLWSYLRTFQNDCGGYRPSPFLPSIPSHPLPLHYPLPTLLSPLPLCFSPFSSNPFPASHCKSASLTSSERPGLCWATVFTHLSFLETILSRFKCELQVTKLTSIIVMVLEGRVIFMTCMSPMIGPLLSARHQTHHDHGVPWQNVHNIW